jgi:zinc D-Ala-D-Ala carboxypeptidase
MGDLSPHFSRSEFDCHDGQIAHPDPKLIACLERLRTACGNRPLRIIDGYRDPAYNKRIGGAPNSQHMYNRAADIPAGYATIAQAEASGFTGIGHDRSGRVIHVDVRPGQRVVFLDT